MDQVEFSRKNVLLPRFVRENVQKMSVAWVLARFEVFKGIWRCDWSPGRKEPGELQASY
jgi:hypothetical protein